MNYNITKNKYSKYSIYYILYIIFYIFYYLSFLSLPQEHKNTVCSFTPKCAIVK